eukprot:m.99318 g.99318  ORF g.99318 m.99318 type:complete len:146 (+) comp37061_c0_seq1:620-1057(+)
MAVNGKADSLLEYTRDWIRKVDRCGLFDINDNVFSLFKEIELCTRDCLTATLTTNDQSVTRKEIIDMACSDAIILHHWTLISSDIDVDHSIILLQEIVSLWITIRGFSIAGLWMELYKNVRSKTTAKSKSLRKSLIKHYTNESDK